MTRGADAERLVGDHLRAAMRADFRLHPNVRCVAHPGVTAWVLVAIAVGWLAAEKGRSPIVWFLVALIGSTFALILVGFAPRGASGAYRRCRACREPIRCEADLCPFCRTSRPTDALLEDAPPS